MLKLTSRQNKILERIRELGTASNQEIKETLNNISRITLIRDLNFLLKNDLISKKGKGRGVFYEEKTKQSFLRYINIDKYFQKEADQRNIKFSNFNFEIFESIKKILDPIESQQLNLLNSKYQKRVKSLSENIVKKEFERLTIELSWKSSKIEGNTYSLIDTEILIKENREASGHKKEEAIMILNHKKALDYISDQRSNFKKLNISKIESIHNLIVNDLNVEKGIRKKPVGIIGTRYMPLDNQHQIREAMEKMVKTLNNMQNVFDKALFAIAVLSYIQPFEDGNKRTARLLSNALLLANNACPLSFRSIDEADYKKALIIFFEQNNLRAFKEIFVEQFKFSIENYFL